MWTWSRGRTLGRGGFAVVSLAVASDQGSNLPSVMAVKSAPLSESRSLRREARFFKDFEGCPYLVRCFGADVTIENGEQFYNILLEYASGGSLADRLRSSGRGIGLPECQVRRYSQSVLMGLSFMHKQGYVHCDIKPGNILLVESDLSIPPPLSSSISKRKRKRVEETTAKISDFGLAKKAGQMKDRREGSRRLRGTPLYIAPESVLHGEYEPCADIWALGCTLLHLITGKEPWKRKPGTDRAAVLFQIGFTESVPEIPSWLSKAAQDFLGKCLVRDPKSRWSADMLLQHPFVSGIDRAFTGSIKHAGNRVLLPKAVKAVCDSSPQSSIDLPKPYLLMSHSPSIGVMPARPNSCTATRHSDFIALEDTGEFPACEKQKRMEEDAEQGKSGISFQLDGLRQYWGIKQISEISNSSIAIEIFE